MMGSSLLISYSRDFGTSMPTKSQEESISSLQQTRSALTSIAAALAAERRCSTDSAGVGGTREAAQR
jgi:DNA-binding FadR family transcriptional regulator